MRIDDNLTLPLKRSHFENKMYWQPRSYLYNFWNLIQACSGSQSFAPKFASPYSAWHVVLILTHVTSLRSTDSSDQQPSLSSRDPYSSRDSGIPGSLERPRCVCVLLYCKVYYSIIKNGDYLLYQALNYLEIWSFMCCWKNIICKTCTNFEL